MKNNNDNLIKSANTGDLKAVQECIKSGADINTTDLVDSTALMIASSRGYLEIVKYLLDSGANVNHVSDFGGSSLWNAAHYGYLEIVKCLVENSTAGVQTQGVHSSCKGANVNIKHEQL